MGVNQGGTFRGPKPRRVNVQTNSLARVGLAAYGQYRHQSEPGFRGGLRVSAPVKLNANAFFDNRIGKDRGPFAETILVLSWAVLTPARNSTFFFVNVQRILVAAPVSRR
jgi:hypothetical protein